MACGVSVIGSDSGAIPWVIGDAGMVFPEGDAAALAGGLRKIMADDTARAEMSEKAVKRAGTEFSNAAVARRYLDFYGGLTDSEGQHGQKYDALKKILHYALGAFCVYWIYDIYRNFYGNYEPKWRYYVAGLFAAAYVSRFLKPVFLYTIKKYTLRTLTIFCVLSVMAAAIVHTRDFTAFAASCLAWYLVGDFFIGLFALDISRAERLTFSMAAGMAFFSYILLAMGLLEMFGAAQLWSAVVIVIAALGIRKLPRPTANGGIIAVVKERSTAILQRVKGMESFIARDNGAFAMIVIAALMFIVVIGSNLAPPTLVDDMLYHLTIPKIWVRNGAVIPTHWVALPFSLEILCAQGMAMGSEYIFAGLTNITFAALLFGAFFAAGRRFFGGGMAGVTAFLFLFSVVYYILHLFSFSTDMKFLLFFILAFHSFLAWIDARDTKWLFISAIMTGFSMGFRYHGVLLAAFLALAAAAAMITSGKDKPPIIAAKLLAFCALTTTAALPSIFNIVWIC
ncbi:MAG: glycosyltransferase family 39 protein [Endomicrobiia bacterium]|nr:glycosyltransferase family 39 protein [Endomicrobiia bacterium]